MKKIFIVFTVIVLLLMALCAFIFTNPNIKRNEHYLNYYVKNHDIDYVSMQKNLFSSYLPIFEDKEEVIKILQAMDVCNIDFIREVNLEEHFIWTEGISINVYSSSNGSTSYIVYSDGTVAKIDYENKIIEYSSANIADYDKLSQYVY